MQLGRAGSMPRWWIRRASSSTGWLAAAIGVGPEAVIKGRNTGHDLDMMRAELGFRCIAVGNASEKLSQVHEPQIYHAAAYDSAGIHEGLIHYGWLPAAPKQYESAMQEVL